MSEFEEDVVVEEENPVLHLELEDGTNVDCAVIALFEVDGQDYIALVSVEELESDNEESALLIYRYVASEDEESFSLDNIESDEEFEKVTAALDEIMEEEDDEI